MATRKSAKRSGKAAKDAKGVVPPTTMTSPVTATGAQIHQDDQDIPSGKDRGSQVPIEGGNIKPDWDNPKPIGAQAEPAKFTSNGQLPHNTVGSQSGPVPVSAVAGSPEEAKKILDQQSELHAEFIARKTAGEGDKRLSDATVNRLGRSELLAIAHQRGYELSDVHGTRTTRRAFIDAQGKDKTLGKGEEV